MVPVHCFHFSNSHCPPGSLSGVFWCRLGVASYPPFPPDVAVTGSPTETSLLSHRTPGFRYFKPLVRASDLELSLSLPKRPKDLKHRLGPRTGPNPAFELVIRWIGDRELELEPTGCGHWYVFRVLGTTGTRVRSPGITVGFARGSAPGGMTRIPRWWIARRTCADTVSVPKHAQRLMT